MSVVPYSHSNSSNRSVGVTVIRRSTSALSLNTYDNSKRNNNDEERSISIKDIKQFIYQLCKDKQFRLAESVLSKIDMQTALRSRQIDIDSNLIFNVCLSDEGEPITDQKQSGRCWLFSITNVIRIFVARQYNLEQFQLSQSYLYFYDHLAKANWFLESMIDLANQPLDSRTVQYLLSGSAAQDGGAYDMAVALIQEYGLVPQSIYTESFNTSSSNHLDELLNSKLREYALELRTMINQQLGKNESMREVRQLKREQMKEVFRILATCCGMPPAPTDTFEWEFYDKNKRYQRIVTSPLNFVRSHTGSYDISSTIVLVNDPRHSFNQIYTVDKLGNVVGSQRQVKYLNVSIEQIKLFTKQTLQDKVPVWFGCDVEKASNMDKGVMDLHLCEITQEDAFGTGASVNMTKKERLEMGDSSMTHAMMFTGVHVNHDTGRPKKWKVENSWGPKACNHGFFVMSDDWFSEYVYQVAILRSRLPVELLRIYDNSRVTVLPCWDPLGALAKAG
ncbi:bleomycin hydrolase [Microbotryomycetes sp. JL221]|nr:bleomycin hydrolase [Microbotryomycetes sp. JL221]